MAAEPPLGSLSCRHWAKDSSFSGFHRGQHSCGCDPGPAVSPVQFARFPHKGLMSHACPLASNITVQMRQ